MKLRVVVQIAYKSRTWFSGLGVLHFLILQTVRKAKFMLWQFGHSQSLSRPAPAVKIRGKRQRFNQV
jgi:hypothetical protein